MNHEPDFLANLRGEFSDWRVWRDRTIVLAYAIASGLFVVGFTVAVEWVFRLFEQRHHRVQWTVLLWTPTVTAFIVWTTRR